MSDAPQYGWEAPRNVLYLGLTCGYVCESCEVEVSKETEEESGRREVVKRGTAFCTGGNRVAKRVPNSHARDRHGIRTGYARDTYGIRTGYAQDTGHVSTVPVRARNMYGTYDVKYRLIPRE
jgi:hypothetical protein